jgi:hemolysin III
LLAGPQLVAALRFDQLVLIGAGGLLFTGGAITLALHRPDPIPHIFGYHEVWHVLVTCAVVCQLIAIASLVSSAPSA